MAASSCWRNPIPVNPLSPTEPHGAQKRSQDQVEITDCPLKPTSHLSIPTKRLQWMLKDPQLASSPLPGSHGLQILMRRSPHHHPFPPHRLSHHLRGSHQLQPTRTILHGAPQSPQSGTRSPRLRRKPQKAPASASSLSSPPLSFLAAALFPISAPLYFIRRRRQKMGMMYHT